MYYNIKKMDENIEKMDRIIYEYYEKLIKLPESKDIIEIKKLMYDYMDFKNKYTKSLILNKKMRPDYEAEYLTNQSRQRIQDSISKCIVLCLKTNNLLN